MPDKKDKVSSVDTQILESCKKFYDTYSPLLTKQKERLNEFYNLYRGKTKRKSYKGKANVFPPEIYRGVETLVANTYGMLFSEDLFFISSPKTREREEYAKQMVSVMMEQLHSMGFFRKMMQILRKSATEGVTVVGLFWDFVEKIMPFIKGEGGVVQENQKVVLRDNANLEIESTIDVILNPMGDIQKDGIMIIKKASWEDLVQMQEDEIVEGIDRVKDGGNSKIGEAEKEIREERIKMAGFDTPKEEKEKGEYYLYHKWGNIPKKWIYKDAADGDELISGHLVICNNIVIGARQNPFWHQQVPYFNVPWIELFGEAFGLGAAEIGESSMIELIDTHNQMLDHKTFSLYGVTLKKRSANISNSDLKKNPDQIIETDDMDGLKIFTPPPQAFQEGNITENIVKDDIRNGMGATSTLQGIALSKRQTQGEINLLAMQGGSRIRLIATNLAEAFLKPFLRQLYWLCQQYIDKEQKIKIIGAEGIRYETLRPEEIFGELDFTPKVMTDPENRQTRRMNLVSFGQFALPVLEPNARHTLARKIYNTFGYKDGNEVVPPPLPESYKYHIEPEKEHELFARGQYFSPWQFEDHMFHLRIHTEYLRELAAAEEGEDTEATETGELLKKHMEEHVRMGNIRQMLAQQAPPPGGQT